MTQTTHAREAGGAGGGAGGKRAPAAEGRSFNELLKHWKASRGEGDPRAELALGELVVASNGGRPSDRMWAHATLASDQIDNGRYARARELLIEAESLAGSLLLMSTTSGGVEGFHKQHALYQLNRARCNLATRQHRNDETSTACAQALERAREAASLRRFSGGGEAGADSMVLNALLARAWADRQAARLTSAAAGMREAAALAASGAARREPTAHFYRVASRMALDEGDLRQSLDWAQRAVAQWPGAEDNKLSSAVLKSRNTLQNALVAMGDWQAANEQFDQVTESPLAMSWQPLRT